MVPRSVPRNTPGNAPRNRFLEPFAKFTVPSSQLSTCFGGCYWAPYQAPVSGSGNLEGGVEEELISLASEGSSGDSSSPVQVLARKLILIHQDVLSLADFVRSSDFADDTVGSVLSESGVVANPIFLFIFFAKQ